MTKHLEGAVLGLAVLGDELKLCGALSSLLLRCGVGSLGVVTVVVSSVCSMVVFGCSPVVCCLWSSKLSSAKARCPEGVDSSGMWIVPGDHDTV